MEPLRNRKGSPAPDPYLVTSSNAQSLDRAVEMMQSSAHEGTSIFRVQDQAPTEANTIVDVACLSGRDGCPRIAYTYVNGVRSETGLSVLWLPWHFAYGGKVPGVVL
jgi:hypothetical protein